MAYPISHSLLFLYGRFMVAPVLLLILLFSLLHPQISKASQADIQNQAAHEKRELWTGSLYTSTYRAGVCIAPSGAVRGVLLLRLKSGKVDVYHFQGAMDSKGIITLRHTSGHSFVGNFEDDTTINGKITLKNGFRVSLSGARSHDAQLTETCRPLPE